MFINIGDDVDEGTMVDSHALAGSCAQIGKRVQLWFRDRDRHPVNLRRRITFPSMFPSL
jgi:hypothetical protein